MGQARASTGLAPRVQPRRKTTVPCVPSICPQGSRCPSLTRLSFLGDVKPREETIRCRASQGSQTELVTSWHPGPGHTAASVSVCISVWSFRQNLKRVHFRGGETEVQRIEGTHPRVPSSWGRAGPEAGPSDSPSRSPSPAFGLQRGHLSRLSPVEAALPV